MSARRTEHQLDWLLDDLVTRVDGARHAIVLSADGLSVGRSHSLSTDDADHLAAVASGLQSLARGTGVHFGGGPVRQTVVELDEVYLIVTGAGQGSSLALLTGSEANLGLVAYAMNLLVKRVGQFLGAGTRTENAGARPIDPVS